MLLAQADSSAVLKWAEVIADIIQERNLMIPKLPPLPGMIEAPSSQLPEKMRELQKAEGSKQNAKP
jgi:hypothetical protein